MKTKGKLCLKKLTFEKRKRLEAYGFILPWIIGFILFFLYPLIYSIILSFSKIDRQGGMHLVFIGFQNYIRAFVWEIYFIPTLLGVIKYTFTDTPLILIFSLILAVLINKQYRLKGFFRWVLFMPVLLGTGYVMKQLLGQQVNERAMSISRGISMPREILMYLGPGFSNTIQGFLNRITVILWKSGVQTLLFLAGLQNIPVSLYESARCDSATEWDMFWKITLPMIIPVIFLNTIYTIIESFVDSSNPMVDYFYTVSFRNMQFEYSAAIAWIYMVLIILTVAIVYVLLKYVFKYDDNPR